MKSSLMKVTCCYLCVPFLCTLQKKSSVITSTGSFFAILALAVAPCTHCPHFCHLAIYVCRPPCASLGTPVLRGEEEQMPLESS